ncbi:hypothetical protein AVEN_247014-1 [Araneus ventricosus]|uniref:Uncharacterized protein n=1 Tax=Araneus ventricosus TaxID=182803 RepID=A0A4Y2TMV7_ARAVE|nr:hypothetical protein AVEN_247014-1 [Araneus ventricosus]
MAPLKSGARGSTPPLPPGRYATCQALQRKGRSLRHRLGSSQRWQSRSRELHLLNLILVGNRWSFISLHNREDLPVTKEARNQDE